MGDITENFSYKEFKPSSAADTWVPTNQYQKILINNLASNLQVIRSKIPTTASMKITAGVRTTADYDRLVQGGFHPSETSDHYCGEVVSISSTSPNFNKFGLKYIFSVGAADVVPTGIDIELFFKIAVQYTMSGLSNFGQIIFEQDPVKNVKWVHFSNSCQVAFSPLIEKFLERERFLVTTDGGKSYLKYSV
jgi:hypothetical protein